MFNLPDKYVEIDGFRIPADKAEEYKRIRDRMIKEAEKFFRTFCEVVKREKLVDLLGEGIVGYSSTGEMLARISLDPFELSAMNVALQRKKIKEYMLATNGYDDDDYKQLLKEFDERKAERKAKKQEGLLANDSASCRQYGRCSEGFPGAARQCSCDSSFYLGEGGICAGK